MSIEIGVRSGSAISGLVLVLFCWFIWQVCCQHWLPLNGCMPLYAKIGEINVSIIADEIVIALNDLIAKAEESRTRHDDYSQSAQKAAGGTVQTARGEGW